MYVSKNVVNYIIWSVFAADFFHPLSNFLDFFVKNFNAKNLQDSFPTSCFQAHFNKGDNSGRWTFFEEQICQCCIINTVLGWCIYDTTERTRFHKGGSRNSVDGGGNFVFHSPFCHASLLPWVSMHVDEIIERGEEGDTRLFIRDICNSWVLDMMRNQQTEFWRWFGSNMPPDLLSWICLWSAQNVHNNFREFQIPVYFFM